MTRPATTLRLKVKCQRAFLETSSQRAYLSALCDAVVEESPYRFAFVTEPALVPGRLPEVVAAAGFEEADIICEDLLTLRQGCGPGVTHQAHQMLKCVVVRSLADDPMYAGWGDDLVRLGLRGAMALPLAAGGKLAGILTVYATEPDAFLPADVALFHAIADEVATCALSLSRTEEISDVEETLYRETDFAAAVLNTVDAVIVVLDLHGRIVTANQRAAELAGLSDVELRGRPAARLLARGFEALFTGLVRDVLQRGEAANPLEIGVLDTSGQVRLIDWRTTILRDEWGSAEYVVAAGLDVTDRRRAEEGLRERERYLSALGRVTSLLLPAAARVPYEEFLDIVGPATGAQRALCVLAARNQRSEVSGRTVAEWCASGCPPVRDRYADSILDAHPFRAWCEMLARGHTVCVVAGSCSRLDAKLLDILDSQALLIVPLMVDGQFSGFVGLDNPAQPRAWTPQEMEFLSAAVQSLAQRLKREQAVSQRKALQRLAHRLTAPLTPHAIGKVVAEECRSLFLHDALALGLLDHTGTTMTGIYEEDTPEDANAPIEGAATDFPVFDRKTGERCWQGKPLLVNRPEVPDTSPYLPFLQHQRLSRSLMFVPVCWQGKSVGSLTVQSYTPDRYDEADLRLLESVADHVGGALERARAEEALHRVTMNLAQAQRIARFGSWELDVRTGLHWWSDEAYRLLGYEPGEVTPSLDLLLSHIHPDDRKMARRAFADARVNRGPHDIRCRVVRRDGTIIHVHALGGELMRNAQGKPVALIGTAHDITAQVEAEESLRRSERLLAKAQQMAHLGHWEVDFRARKVMWSDELFQILGRDPGIETPSVERFYDSVHADDLPHVREAARLARRGLAPFDEEYRVVRPDGSVRHVHSVAEFAWDAEGAALRVTGTTLDITERKLVEQALRRSERLLAAAQRMARIAHWEFDVQRRVAEASEEFFLIGGLKPFSVRLTPEFLLSIIHSDDRHRVEAAIRRAIAGDAVLDEEYRVLRPDGSIRHVHAHAEIVCHADGQVSRLVGFVQDITERKLTEEALRQSERMLARAQEIARLGHFEYDLAGRQSVWSDELYRLCGFEPGAFVPTLDIISEMIHPDDRQRVLDAMDHAIQNGSVIDMEYRAVRRDGEIRTFHVLCEPVRNAEAAVIRLMGTVQDVTERVQASQRIRESEQALAKAQEIAHLGHWIFDIASGVATCSDEMYRIFGHEPQSVPFSYELFLSRLHPGDRAWVDECNRACFETGKEYDAEYRIIRPDGTLRYVHSHATYERDASGSPVRGIGTTLDITERKRAEEDLRESERRYRAVVEAQTELVCRSKPDTTLIFVNDAYCRYYGKSREELLGCSFLANVPDEDVPIVAQAFEDAIRRGGCVTTFHRALKPDGEVRWQHWTTVPILAPSGEVIEMQGVGRDITEQRRAEEALRESERRYALATEAAKGGVWHADLASGRVKVEPGLYRMLEHDPPDNAANSSDWYHLIHPEDRDGFLCDVKRLADGLCESLTLRVRLVCHSGAVRWMQVAMKLLRDADGCPASILGANADISEQCLAESLLGQLDLFFRELVLHPHRILYRAQCGENGFPISYTYMGSGIEALTGLAVADVTPLSLRALVREHRVLSPAMTHRGTEGPPRFADGIAQRYEAEYRLVTPQGEERWVKDVSLPVFDSLSRHPKGIIGMLWDITEEKARGD